MSENIFERLARKIEASRKRGEAERKAALKPGFFETASGLGYNGLAEAVKRAAKKPKAPAPQQPDAVAQDGKTCLDHKVEADLTNPEHWVSDKVETPPVGWIGRTYNGSENPIGNWARPPLRRQVEGFTTERVWGGRKWLTTGAFSVDVGCWWLRGPKAEVEAPQVDWTKTSVRKPPKVGAYPMKFAADGLAYVAPNVRSWWDGEQWHSLPEPSSPVYVMQNELWWRDPRPEDDNA